MHNRPNGVSPDGRFFSGLRVAVHTGISLNTHETESLQKLDVYFVRLLCDPSSATNKGTTAFFPWCPPYPEARNAHSEQSHPFGTCTALANRFTKHKPAHKTISLD